MYITYALDATGPASSPEVQIQPAFGVEFIIIESKEEALSL